jgi:hypothetical protein
MKSPSSPNSSWVRLPHWSVGLLAARKIAINRRIGVSIAAVLPGLLAVASVTLVAGMLAPSHAYTTEDLETVYRVEGEGYDALVRRAESAARSSAQQKFDSDILLTRVVITVLGQNGGQLAPILVLDVNRNDWRNRPDPQYWAKYYRTTRLLLELDSSAPQTTSTPPQPSLTPGEPTLDLPLTPGGTPAPGQSLPASQLLPSGANSPPSINIPAAPAGQVGLPRAILRR